MLWWSRMAPQLFSTLSFTKLISIVLVDALTHDGARPSAGTTSIVKSYRLSSKLLWPFMSSTLSVDQMTSSKLSEGISQNIAALGCQVVYDFPRDFLRGHTCYASGYCHHTSWVKLLTHLLYLKKTRFTFCDVRIILNLLVWNTWGLQEGYTFSANNCSQWKMKYFSLESYCKSWERGDIFSFQTTQGDKCHHAQSGSMFKSIFSVKSFWKF